MEVHHHNQPTQKKWTHYLWEFLMLFLAVFCGFLAENQREHFAEHKREKDFMASMINDLQADTTSFSQMINGITIINAHIDSIIPLLSNTNDLDKNAPEIYRHEVWLNLYYKNIYTDRTIEQLKNGGNFRLIRKKEISDDIIKYDGYVRNFVISMQDNGLLPLWQKVDDQRTSIFNSMVFKNWLQAGLKEGFNAYAIQLPPAPYFLSTDKRQIDVYINLLNKYSVMNLWFVQNAKAAVQQAIGLDSLIKKEYRLN